MRAVELWAGDLASHRARRDLHAGIISDPLVFSRVAAGHDVEPAILLAKPNRRGNRDAILAEGGKADVILTSDFGRNRHVNILLQAVSPFVKKSKEPKAPLRTLPHSLWVCYKPSDAQMDA